MQTADITAEAARPVIHLIDTEYDLIADLALKLEKRSPAIASMLMAELDRAEVHTAETLPPGVVALGSTV
jgi:regulator of nucleoside diphosphate kinase